MKCFGKNHKSFAKPIKKNFEDLAAVDIIQTVTPQRATFRKSKLTNNTDSGLYSDESGPEDRPKNINQGNAKLKIKSPEILSNPSTPNSALDNSMKLSQIKSKVPESWYHPSLSSNSDYERGAVSPVSLNMKSNFVQCQGNKDSESPISIKKLMKLRSFSLNTSNRIQAADSNSQNSQNNIKNQYSASDIKENPLSAENGNHLTSEDNVVNYFEFDTLKSPVVKINREAFDRLTTEYLSEYDSEDEMEKTLAECIAMDEMKRQKVHISYDSSNDSSRSSVSSNKIFRAEKIKNVASEPIYSEVIKKPRINSPNINELIINEPVNDNFRCNIHRQKTLHSLHRFLDLVDAFMNKDKNSFKANQIAAMKDHCTILSENLSIFENLGIRAMQNDERELRNKENVNKCISSLNVIKKNILNYSNLIGNLSNNQNSEQSFSTSVAAILNHTKTIPDLIRTLDYSISKKPEINPVDSIKTSRKNNNTIIVLDRQNSQGREKPDLKKSSKPIDLDLVQNINDNHIYDEVAEEQTSPNTKVILNELNHMMAELTSSTPIKKDKYNKCESKLIDDMLIERISPIEISSNKIEPFSIKLDVDKLKRNSIDEKLNAPNKSSSKMTIDPQILYVNNTNIDTENDITNRYESRKEQNPIKSNFNVANSIPDIDARGSNQKSEDLTNYSTASLLDLETKFANMLNLLSSSKDALSKQDPGSKHLNKSLNNLEEMNKTNEIYECPNDCSVSTQLLTNADLDSVLKSSLGINPNTVISERQSSTKSIISQIKDGIHGKEIMSNTNIIDFNKHQEILTNLQNQLECRNIDAFRSDPAVKSDQPTTENGQLSNKLNFYSREMTDHWKTLIEMSDAFFRFIEQLNESKEADDVEDRIVGGPRASSLLMSYVKLVVRAGQRVVQVADALLDDLGDAAAGEQLDSVGEALCGGLKDVVARTKDAANDFGSIPRLQSLVDSVKNVADRAADMRSALGRISA